MFDQYNEESSCSPTVKLEDRKTIIQVETMDPSMVHIEGKESVF